MEALFGSTPRGENLRKPSGQKINWRPIFLGGDPRFSPIGGLRESPNMGGILNLKIRKVIKKNILKIFLNYIN